MTLKPSLRRFSSYRAPFTTQGLLDNVKAQYPSVRTWLDMQAFLTEDMEAVIVVTPASTHHDIVSQCLSRDLHVLVEKPMTLTSSDSLKLKELSDLKGKLLMVGQTFVYNDGVAMLKELHAKEADFGQLHYMHSKRTNLGPIRSDTSCLVRHCITA